MDRVWDKTKEQLVKFINFHKRNRIKRYGLPILLVTSVYITKHLSYNLLGDHSAFLLVSFVVVVSSWYGGFGPGIFATIISAVVVYLSYLSQDITKHPLLGDIILIIFFIGEGIVISLANKARFEIEEQKDEFIGYVAHELKNPLAAISGFAGLIMHTANKKGYEKIEKYSMSINSSSLRMLELINDLLDITKIEVGKFSYTNSLFNIDELVNELVYSQRVINSYRSIEYLSTKPIYLYADRYRIGQVITNLLTNAIKYSQEDKKVVVKVKKYSNFFVLSVRDFGIGIKTSDQKTIFHKFFRSNQTKQNKSEGLGLGLFISSQIVNHYNGSLMVTSKLGKGSIFYLRLPTAHIGNIKSVTKNKGNNTSNFSINFNPGLLSIIFSKKVFSEIFKESEFKRTFLTSNFLSHK